MHYPDRKVHGVNMGPTWVLPAPDGPHVGPMYLAIRNVWINLGLSLVIMVTGDGKKYVIESRYRFPARL